MIDTNDDDFIPPDDTDEDTRKRFHYPSQTFHNTKPSGTTELHKLSGIIKFRTAKAIQFAEVIDGEEQRAEWYPLSQVPRVVTASVLNGNADEIYIALWLAKKKGLV